MDLCGRTTKADLSMTLRDVLMSNMAAKTRMQRETKWKNWSYATFNVREQNTTNHEVLHCGPDDVSIGYFTKSDPVTIEKLQIPERMIDTHKAMWHMSFESMWRYFKPALDHMKANRQQMAIIRKKIETNMRQLRSVQESKQQSW